MKWSLIYKDKNGLEETVMNNDGENLSTVIRGITYEGRDFDCLKSITHKGDDESLLTSEYNWLDNCQLKCSIKIPVQDINQLITCNLQMDLWLGNLLSHDVPHNERLKLTLNYKDQCIESAGNSEEFECELLSIQKQLGEGVYLKACINCAYSDYSPYGHGLFGDMMCFKNVKKRYITVKSKDDLWLIHDDFDRYVQETYLCEEFSKRKPGTGYRG